MVRTQVSIADMTTGMKIATYLDLKAKEKALKAEIAELEGSIKAAMGDSSEVRENGFVARIVEGTQRKFDTTRFKAEYADMYEAYRHDVPTKSFQAFVEG